MESGRCGSRKSRDPAGGCACCVCGICLLSSFRSVVCCHPLPPGLPPVPSLCLEFLHHPVAPCDSVCLAVSGTHTCRVTKCALPGDKRGLCLASRTCGALPWLTGRERLRVTTGNRKLPQGCAGQAASCAVPEGRQACRVGSAGPGLAAAVLGVTFGCAPAQADGRVCPWAVSGWDGPLPPWSLLAADLAVLHLPLHGSDSPASLRPGCPSGQEAVGGCREPGARASLGVHSGRMESKRARSAAGGGVTWCRKLAGPPRVRRAPEFGVLLGSMCCAGRMMIMLIFF